MKKYLIIILTLIFLVGVNSVILAQDQSQLPTFRIRNLSGELFDSRKHLGKPIVLSFFFSRCPPCIKEMPALYEFMSQEGRLNQLLFIDPYVKALNVTEVPDTERQIRKFINLLDIPPENVYFDQLGTLLKKMSSYGAFPRAKSIGTLVIYPTIIVTDGSGKLVMALEAPGTGFLDKIKKVL
jgi:thiol-disulfide isomerase/thioredoxin